MAIEAAPFIVAAVLVLVSEISGYLVQGKVESHYRVKWATLESGPPGFARDTEIGRVVGWALAAAQAMSAGIAPMLAGLFLLGDHHTVLLNLGYTASLLFGFGMFALVFAWDPEKFPYSDRLGVSVPGRIALGLNVVLAGAVFVFG